jgi:hypothetical protein
MSKPTVSVILSTFNHAPFVQETMRSVLSQQNVDFEFLIADDGSQDGTAEAVRAIQDPRIRFTAHPANRGAAEVTNELIDLAQGEFIALINSDDAWLSETKLQDQIAILRSDPSIGASFGMPVFMDKDSKPIPREEVFLAQFFDQVTRTQAEMLRIFFEAGNCLCHPTLLIRRQCYVELGGYNNRFRQLPDFDMWVRLVKHYKIHISQTPWVRYRLLPGENASSPSMANYNRDTNERFLIAEHCLSDVSPELLREAFSDLINPAHPFDATHIAIARVIPYMKSQNPFLKRVYRLTALRKLRELLDDDAHRHLLTQLYDIDDKWFQGQLGEEDCLTIDTWISQFIHSTVHQAQVDELKQNITSQDELTSSLKAERDAQQEVIASLKRDVQQPLFRIALKRLFSKIL